MKLRRVDMAVLIVAIVIGLSAVVLLLPSRWAWWKTRTVEDVPASTIRQSLQALQVRDSHETPKYERDQFGPAWNDEDGNGCDTRNDVLARDLNEVVFRAHTRDCIVISGWFDDPYTGQRIRFVRGNDTSPLVQIDHVVSLADAWRAGAWQWNAAQRQKYANDPLNLMAVDGPTNENKGSGRADQWLPPNVEYHCAYVARQVQVKAKWALTVTASERQTMIDVLADCPVMDTPGQ